jgi:hopene-associated glycosyltransferase HpnB
VIHRSACDLFFETTLAPNQGCARSAGCGCELPQTHWADIMIAAWVGAFTFFIWVYLLAGRGRFWRVSSTTADPELLLASPPRVAVVVPARNEADVVGRAIRSLLEQDYAGRLQVFVVDDHSSDETANVARQAAADKAERVTVISAMPLPAGWKGKMWALSQGVHQAAGFAPDYFLFTDADIVHAPESITGLVARAQSGKLDLVSMMVLLRCSSLAERALIPAFVFFFFMLYPPEWVSSLKHRTAAAAGGDILVRAEALARIGGIAAIRNELIDDCALAREIKRNGSIWLGLTPNTCSIRGYESFGSAGSMISRNAFYQLRHSGWLLIATVLGLVITYLSPPVLVFLGGWAALWGGAAWLLMSAAFWPTLRFYSRSLLWAPLLPLIALFYAGATIHSAVLYWLGHGGEWKGRMQDVKTHLTG